MAAQSSILAGEIPWSEEPGGLQPMGLLESDMTQRTYTHTHTHTHTHTPASPHTALPLRTTA